MIIANSGQNLSLLMITSYTAGSGTVENGYITESYLITLIPLCFSNAIFEYDKTPIYHRSFIALFMIHTI